MNEEPKITISFTVEAEEAEDLILLHTLLERPTSDLTCLKSFVHLEDHIKHWLFMMREALGAYDYVGLVDDDLPEKISDASAIFERQPKERHDAGA